MRSTFGRHRSISGRTRTPCSGRRTSSSSTLRAPAIRGQLGDAAKPADFYGVDQDADAFAKAIIRYVTKFDKRELLDKQLIDSNRR